MKSVSCHCSLTFLFSGASDRQFTREWHKLVVVEVMVWHFVSRSCKFWLPSLLCYVQIAKLWLWKFLCNLINLDNSDHKICSYKVHSLYKVHPSTTTNLYLKLLLNTFQYFSLEGQFKQESKCLFLQGLQF